VYFGLAQKLRRRTPRNFHCIFKNLVISVTSFKFDPKPGIRYSKENGTVLKRPGKKASSAQQTDARLLTPDPPDTEVAFVYTEYSWRTNATVSFYAEHRTHTMQPERTLQCLETLAFSEDQNIHRFKQRWLHRFH